jgi:hypothetical protein
MPELAVHTKLLLLQHCCAEHWLQHAMHNSDRFDSADCQAQAYLSHGHIGVGCHPVTAAVAECCHVCCVFARWDGWDALKGVVHSGDLLKDLSLGTAAAAAAAAAAAGHLGRHALNK